MSTATIFPTLASAVNGIAGDDNVEFEIRFYTNPETQQSSVTANQFARLSAYLGNKTGKNPQFVAINDVNITGNNNDTYRFSDIGGSPSYIIKKRFIPKESKSTEMIFEEESKIAINTEKKITEQEYKLMASKNMGIINNRPKLRKTYDYSTTVNPQNILIQTQWRIDMTKVVTNDKETFEVEIECTNAIKLLNDLKPFKDDVLRESALIIIALKIIREIRGALYSQFYFHSFTRSVLKSLKDAIRPGGSKIVLAKPRNMTEADISSKGLIEGAFRYIIRHKVDGVHQCLFIQKESGIWLVMDESEEYALILSRKQVEQYASGGKTEEEKIKRRQESDEFTTFLKRYDGTMLDGEYVESDIQAVGKNKGIRYVVSDIIMQDGKTAINKENEIVRAKAYESFIMRDAKLSVLPRIIGDAIVILGKHSYAVRDRRSTLTTAIEHLLGMQHDSKYKLKDTPRRAPSLDEIQSGRIESLHVVVPNHENLAYPIDGFIIMSIEAPYLPLTPRGTPVQYEPIEERVLTRYPDVVKWKFRYTGDVYTKQITLDNGDVGIEFYSSGSRNDKTKNKLLDIQSNEVDVKSFLDQNLLFTDVVEIFFDTSKGKYTFYKRRPDKPKANSYEVMLDNIRHMRNPITLGTLLGIDPKMATYRKYHNAIKAWLIQEIGQNSIVWDWGSGKGGDLKKWEDAGFSRVYASEPNPEHMRELENRLSVIKSKKGGYSVDVKTIHATVQESKIPEKVDAITALLSLSFFWKNEESVREIAGIIKDRLLPGGIMAVFVFDADSLLLRANKDQITKIVGSGYTLDMDVGNRTVRIDMKESATVHNQDEYMVFISDLIALTGMKIESWYWADTDHSLTTEEYALSRHFGYGILRMPDETQNENIVYDMPPQIVPIASRAFKHQVDKLWNDLI